MALALVRLALGVVALALAFGWRSPVSSAVHPAVLALVVIVPLGLVLIETRALLARTKRPLLRALALSRHCRADAGGG